MTATGGVGRWTRYFVVGSALSMVSLQSAFLVDVPHRTAATVGLFGAVLPMVFGMAYLLIPSYVGRTLSSQLPPAIHFVATFVGGGLLIGDRLVGLGDFTGSLGTITWCTGIVVFVGALLRSTVPALLADSRVLHRSTTRPQRSTRLATLVIPVAVGYLIVGTAVLLSTIPGLPTLADVPFPAVVHFYGTGFVALLIFGLGIRLLTGFFHVTPPKQLSWLVLGCGAVAPGLLASSFWQPPWFLVGAGLEFVAITGYAVLVAVVAIRTDRRRIGLHGIGLGALGGVVAVGIVTVGVSRAQGGPHLAVHVPAVLSGFLVLTILGYAYQFFPVTSGQFRGATDRTALATLHLFGVGIAVQVIGAGSGISWLRTSGALLGLAGVIGYSYLIIRRLLLADRLR